MARRLGLLAGAMATVTWLAAQLPAQSGVPRLWTNEALAGWVLPIAGVKATPTFYTEAEYYAAPVDEVRTYPVYIKRARAEDAEGNGLLQGPSLRGVWYRGPFEHSGSIVAFEEWSDSARLQDDYIPKGWNPPDTRARPIPGHRFGLNLAADEKRALIAFLKTL